MVGTACMRFKLWPAGLEFTGVGYYDNTGLRVRISDQWCTCLAMTPC